VESLRFGVRSEDAKKEFNDVSELRPLGAMLGLDLQHWAARRRRCGQLQNIKGELQQAKRLLGDG
jgi:hypothetical protein